MTEEQEPQSTSATRRRAARAGRNRPFLVTSTANGEVKEESVKESNELSAAVEEAPPPPAARPRRFGSFFSTVEKTEQPKEAEVAQARLARAARGKAASTTSSTEEKAKKEPKVEVKPTKGTLLPTGRPPARTPGWFKTRYIFGIAIYLFGASYIGSFERVLLGTNDKLLFNIFGFPVTISTVLFMVTLIVILLILARLDLIPRSLTGLTRRSATPAQRQSKQTSGQNGQTEARINPPTPTVRSGVKGADDDLYQEYQANRRRSRKR